MNNFAWKLGVLLDALHIPLAIVILLLGGFWMPVHAHVAIVAVTIALQMVCLGCPLNVVTCWLRRRKDPSYTNWGSVTFWLYDKYGRWVGIPIFLVLLLVTHFFLGDYLKTSFKEFF